MIAIGRSGIALRVIYRDRDQFDVLNQACCCQPADLCLKPFSGEELCIYTERGHSPRGQNFDKALDRFGTEVAVREGPGAHQSCVVVLERREWLCEIDLEQLAVRRRIADRLPTSHREHLGREIQTVDSRPPLSVKLHTHDSGSTANVQNRPGSVGETLSKGIDKPPVIHVSVRDNELSVVRRGPPGVERPIVFRGLHPICVVEVELGLAHEPEPTGQVWPVEFDSSPVAILLRTVRNKDRWIEAFGRAVPQHEVRLWPEVGDPNDIEYVCLWKHEWEDLATYPNLRAVLLVSAGVDHVDFSQIPEHLPVVRLNDPAMANDISEYCTHWVIHFARSFDQYRHQQPHARWEIGPRDPDTTVGILGYGAIGAVVADRLASFDYPVISWSRSEKTTPHGSHYVGPAQLNGFMIRCDIVINLLPLSDTTRGIVDAAALEALDNGVMINVGRGATVDERALVAALDGEMRGAVLDVFATEPLPSDSPLWSHPLVTVTPHIAGETNPFSAARLMAANIDRIESGEAPFPIVTATTY